MSNPDSIIITLFVVLVLVVLIPMGYLLVDTIIDVRRCRRRYMQNQEEIDEILESSMKNHKK